MTPQKKYENETGKSVWKIKNYTYTEDYVQWLKAYVKNSDDVVV